MEGRTEWQFDELQVREFGLIQPMLNYLRWLASEEAGRS